MMREKVVVWVTLFIVSNSYYYWKGRREETVTFLPPSFFSLLFGQSQLFNAKAWGPTGSVCLMSLSIFFLNANANANATQMHSGGPHVEFFTPYLLTYWLCNFLFVLSFSKTEEILLPFIRDNSMVFLLLCFIVFLVLVFCSKS